MVLVAWSRRLSTSLIRVLIARYDVPDEVAILVANGNVSGEPGEAKRER